ncbi:hypothetical protein N7G274_002694 [Stereocaulon virgatum]|uniref:B box-type domain-containing protein n=1 Tax=Stereocaulon virgatum TaxID=373712 RepID=A0ABR4AHC6_9LECA
MAQLPHKTFQEVVVHTAKCEECNKHNKAIMYRCTDCGHQFCTPCWAQTGRLGTHSKASDAMQRPTILPYVKVNQKKVVKKKSQPVMRPTRKKKNVISDDEEEVEEDGNNKDVEMREETPAVQKTVRKKRSINVNTGRLSSSSHTPLTGEDSAPLDQANDSPTCFTGGIVPHNTPRTSTLMSPHSPDMSGIDTLLRAAASIESLASQSPASHTSSTPRMRSLKAISIESLCSPSPGPQPYTPSTPRTSRLPDLSSHANSSFARRAAQMHDQHFIPEEEEDVPMYDYSRSTGFVPPNSLASPKMRKSRSGSLAGGRGYGADFATRMKARVETDKGWRQVDEYLSQGRERTGLEYAGFPPKPTINQRNGAMSFGDNLLTMGERSAKYGETKRGYGDVNGADGRLQEYQYQHQYPYSPTRPYEHHHKDPRV